MEREFIQLSKKVIKSTDGIEYLSKADSAMSFQRMLYDEEAHYEITVRDTEIQIMNKEGTYTQAILFLICKDEDEKTSFMNIIISDVLGTFISDWY